MANLPDADDEMRQYYAIKPVTVLEQFLRGVFKTQIETGKTSPDKLTGGKLSGSERLGGDSPVQYTAVSYDFQSAGAVKSILSKIGRPACPMTAHVTHNGQTLPVLVPCTGRFGFLPVRQNQRRKKLRGPRTGTDRTDRTVIMPEFGRFSAACRRRSLGIESPGPISNTGTAERTRNGCGTLPTLHPQLPNTKN